MKMKAKHNQYVQDKNSKIQADVKKVHHTRHEPERQQLQLINPPNVKTQHATITSKDQCSKINKYTVTVYERIARN